ncbi:Rrf2 family transcriptional regulator [Aquihabitans sp. G128]|uniref:RrF2 family transcriptional regulator n=1 Tax=Aquihabitans sp. G128 TaxID=2849779 RepID=UPI0020B1F892|nr:Rrf2 family transcriptional regulator [Aquihabitans sp. G128]
MGQGVEWALHACVNLAWAGPERPLPVATLAELNGLPTPYLNKQLQALARAGVVTSTPGARGGFALARPPEEITVLDVVQAIDGTEGAFRCTEIRQQGPLPAGRGAFRSPCQIASVMGRAEAAWRAELAAETVAGLAGEVAAKVPQTPVQIRRWLADRTG